MGSSSSSKFRPLHFTGVNPCPTMPQVPTFQTCKLFHCVNSKMKTATLLSPSPRITHFQQGRLQFAASPLVTPCTTVLMLFKEPSGDAKLSPCTSPSPPAATAVVTHAHCFIHTQLQRQWPSNFHYPTLNNKSACTPSVLISDLSALSSSKRT